MSRTAWHSNSIIVYEPNLALCPGLSARPSPPKISFLLLSFSWLNRVDCLSCHTENMTGCKCERWWLKNVRNEIDAHPNFSKTHSTYKQNVSYNCDRLQQTCAKSQYWLWVCVCVQVCMAALCVQCVLYYCLWWQSTWNRMFLAGTTGYPIHECGHNLDNFVLCG